MTTGKRIAAALTLALMAATVPATATAANFDNKSLEGVYSSTFSSGSTSRAGAYAVDTKADGKAAGTDYLRDSGRLGAVVTWDGNGSRLSSATSTSDLVVGIRPFKTDRNPATGNLYGNWRYNNG